MLLLRVILFNVGAMIFTWAMLRIADIDNQTRSEVWWAVFASLIIIEIAYFLPKIIEYYTNPKDLSKKSNNKLSDAEKILLAKSIRESHQHKKSEQSE